MSKKDAYRAQQQKDAENHAAGRTALGTPGYGGGNGTWEAAPRVQGEHMTTAPTGGTNYRCTRGGASCGATLPGPEQQEGHNAQAHGNSGWGRQGESAEPPDLQKRFDALPTVDGPTPKSQVRDESSNPWSLDADDTPGFR
jgi:hypothetical protein